MNLFKGFSKNEVIPRLSDLGYDDSCTSVRISLYKKLVIVSKNNKFGITLVQEEADHDLRTLTDTSIIVCDCKYDDIKVLSLSDENFCDFEVSKNGYSGIGRVTFGVDGGFIQTEYREILPCICIRERTNDHAAIIQFSIDEDYVRYYHLFTHEISSPYTLIQSSELFITCFDHDIEEISFVHNQTNKLIFKDKAYHCKSIGHYSHGEVYMLDYFGNPFLVFCNDEDAQAYVTDEFEDIRADVTWNKYFNFLTRLFYKTNGEWHTLSPSGDFISQEDISELTTVFDKAIL